MKIREQDMIKHICRVAKEEDATKAIILLDEIEERMLIFKLCHDSQNVPFLRNKEFLFDLSSYLEQIPLEIW